MTAELVCARTPFSMRIGCQAIAELHPVGYSTTAEGGLFGTQNKSRREQVNYTYRQQINTKY